MCGHDLYILGEEDREMSNQIVASSDEYNCIKASALSFPTDMQWTCPQVGYL
jgi:hypothetical protein